MWAQLLNRNQQSTALILIPIQSFIPVDRYTEMRESGEGTESLIRVLYEEHSDLWINVSWNRELDMTFITWPPSSFSSLRVKGTKPRLVGI